MLTNLGHIISTVKQHIRPYMDSIFDMMTVSGPTASYCFKHFFTFFPRTSYVLLLGLVIIFIQKVYIT